MRALIALVAALSLSLGCSEPSDPPADPPPAPEDPAKPTPAEAESPGGAAAPAEAEVPPPSAPEAPPEAPPAAPAAPERTAAPGFMPTPPAFDALPMTARLPADAAGIVVAGSPTDLARRVGWAKMLDALGPGVAGDRAELKQLLGHDLFDPAAWSAMGVDPDAPAGIAVLSVDPPIAAITVSLSNRETLRTVILALAAGVLDMKHADEDGLSLIYTEQQAIGLSDGEAWAVVGDHLEPGEALHHARALAKAPALRMIERADAAPAIAGLNYGRDVAAFVNTPAIIDAVLRQALETAPTRRLERALQGAQALGDADAIKRIGAELDRAREAALKRGPGMLALGMMLRSYLTPFGGTAVGLNIEPQGFQVRFEHRLDLDSPVGSVFASRTGPLALRDAFPRAPVGLVELNLDLKATWELIRALGAAAGGVRDLGLLDGMAREVLGHDVSGLLGMCAGDLGLAVEVDPERVSGTQHADELFGRARFAGHLGLSDPEGAAGALDALVKAEHSQLTPVDGAPAETRMWRLAVDATTTAWFGIGGPQLYVSLDEATVRRLLGGAKGDGFVGRLDPAPRAMLDGSDGGWSGWLDIAGLGPVMLDHTPQITEAPPPGDSKAAQIRAQLAEVDAEIERLQRTHREAEQARGRALLSAFGHAAASIERVPGGLSGRGGLYVGAADPAALVVQVAREVRTTEEATRTLWSETLDPLYTRRRALYAELEALAAGKAPRPVVEPEAPRKPVAPVKGDGPAKTRGPVKGPAKTKGPGAGPGKTKGPAKTKGPVKTKGPTKTGP